MKKIGFIGNARHRVETFLQKDVWDLDLGGLPTFRAFCVRSARVLYLGVRGLVKNNCLNQASALTYITVLSLVPTIALAASVAKGFGAWDHLRSSTIEPFLDDTFGASDGAGAAAGEESVTGEESVVDEDAATDGNAAAPEDDVEPTADGAGASGEGAEEGAEPESEADGATEKLEGTRAVITQILSLVDKTDFQRLGAFGLAFVLLTVIKLLTNVENVLNGIWGAKQSRTMVRKVTDYVALVVVTPLLLIVSTAATGAAQSNEIVSYLAENGMGPVLTLGFKMLPLLSLWLGFGFLYMALPNTHVKISSALLGGVLGGTLWQVFQILHVEFQVGVARYNEVYAGFAAFPIFLVWVYTSWVIVLLGAQLAWAHQAEPEYRELMRDVPTTGADRERLAVHATVAIARAFLRGEEICSTSTLAARFSVPPRSIGDALAPLVDAGVLAQVSSGDGFVPGRDLDRIQVQSILDAVRGTPAVDGEGDGANAVERALDALNAEVARSEHNLSLRALARDEEATPPSSS